jgi:hypothetical protein
VVAIRGDRLSTLVQARRDLVLLHYADHAPFRNSFTVGQKILVNALGPVALLAGFEERFDLWQQDQILGLMIRLPLRSGKLTSQEAIEPTTRYLKHST